MKIIAMSDFHGDLIENIESCDVVCICGDFLPLEIQRDSQKSLKWLKNDFLPWCQSLECNYVLIVSGNHDFIFDEKLHKNSTWDKLCKLFNNFDKVKWIDNKEIIIDNIKFYGCPYTIGPTGWANYCPDQLHPYEDIPKDTDILLVHQPPIGMVGTVNQLDAINYMTCYGSFSMMNKLLMPECNIKYLFCGHIHTGLHSEELIGNTKCYNVSLKDENYKLSFPYKILEI